MASAGLSGKSIRFSCTDSNVKDSPTEIIEIDENIANLSKIVSSMLTDLGGSLSQDTVIPLNVLPDIIKHVINYAKNYLANPLPKDAQSPKKLELSEWDRKFCEALDQKSLFAVILAANFLDIRPLLDVTCLFVALKLKSMTPEEIRKEYNITKEFTPEEEEKARKEFEEMILQTTAKK